MSNLLRAHRHQKLDPTAKHGVTKFSDLTPSEFHDQLKLQRPTLPDSILNAPPLSTNNLPKRVDWRLKSAVTNVKDQCIREKPSICDKGCDGGYTYNASDYIFEAGGIMADSDYPYSGTSTNPCAFDQSSVVSSISKMFYITNKEDQIAAYVARRNPIVAYVNPQYLQSYTGGVICPSECQQPLNHGVLLVGYDADGNWTIKNSWGENWGEQGYFKLCKGHITCFGQEDPIALTVEAN
ncbi:hypothetical protein JRO89_XS02G0223000 [Xanthoceras sorbifolium]|uniref:Peptidase C1A papain C-terminal domain-containing protein n=1 Tax=Xanthoceras sorbifolium TaxID=99658 RepID=A0ABQ8IH08_9ROSI|nr:hypothetical protein JRO89_XS02G0223000 [Xanthoceras sorbifolium]